MFFSSRTIVIHLLLFHQVLSKSCGPDSWIYPVDGVYNTSSDLQENILNVHLIPHTHDDPGWRKTVDQYYYGSKRSVGGEGVQYILDEVIDELLKNPDRRFMYVEQSFFTMWWNEQSSHMKEIVRKLVKEGRLDLSVNGGWCMHDEANTHYTAMIDQTTLGHRFLKKEFNVIPKIGWQIDPFGHSSTNALFSAQMGFDALYFSRIDYEDYDLRMKNSNLEFIWRPTTLDKKKTELFTGISQGGYGPPGTLEFEGGAEPVRDDKRLHDNNICEIVEQVVSDAKDHAQHIQGNHIFFLMGSDFHYQNARMQYKNMDKLIHYVNQDSRINMFYSTLSKYTAAKNAEKLSFQDKSDDFFPYGSSPHGYWTGYFTSRPTQKRYFRIANGFLQAAKQLEVYSPNPFLKSKLHTLAKAVALVQHHDSITGTEKQEVAWDYAMRISQGMKEAENRVSSILNSIVGDSTSSPLDFCWLANVSVCATTQNNKRFQVLVYNPLATDERQAYVRIPVDDPSAVVKDMQNNVIQSDVVEVAIPTPLVKNAAKYNLVFQVNSKGLSLSQYQVTLEKSVINENHHTTNPKPSTLSNKYLEVTFCKHGHLKTIRRISENGTKDDITLALHHDFAYYTAYQGDDGDKSGAYIFRPNSNDAINITNESNTSITFFYGEHVQEATRSWNNNTFVTYRLYKESTRLEVEWTVGDISIADKVGKEIITRFTSDIKSSDTWYTDSNGRQYLERRRNYRPTWNLTLTEPVAANYFPITTGVFIRDNEKQLNILTDRSQGVASLKNGQLEIMVHRRLLYDDAKGVDEALNETECIKGDHGLLAKGTFYLTLERPSASGKQLRQVMDEVFNPLVVGFKSLSSDSLQSTMTSRDFGVDSSKLPSQISLQTLEKVSESEVLLRLSHKYEGNEDPILAKPVQVRITDYFPEGYVKSFNEVSLTANQPISNLRPLSWIVNGDADNSPLSDENSEDPNQVTIHPMQIRTFMVNIGNNWEAEE